MTKDATYRKYGITSHKTGEYEIDHLIPLELGGSNDPRNLWPEKQPGASAKDEVEDTLHREVCSGHTTLQSAWALIRRNYRR